MSESAQLNKDHHDEKGQRYIELGAGAVRPVPDDVYIQSH